MTNPDSPNTQADPAPGETPDGSGADDAPIDAEFEDAPPPPPPSSSPLSKALTALLVLAVIVVAGGALYFGMVRPNAGGADTPADQAADVATESAAEETPPAAEDDVEAASADPQEADADTAAETDADTGADAQAAPAETQQAETDEPALADPASEDAAEPDTAAERSGQTAENTAPDQAEGADPARSQPLPTAAELARVEARLDALEARPEPEPAPAPEPEVTAEDLAALQSELTAVRRQAEAMVDSGGDGDAALAARVAALEDSEPDSGRLLDRLDQIEDRLAELRDLAEQGPDAQDLRALENRIAALENREVAGGGEAAWRFAALREAAGRGAPFEAQRAALAALRPGDTELAAMRDAAASGVPTLAELRASYPAAAIRAAAPQPEPEPGWRGWFAGLAASMVTVRREGEDPVGAERAIADAEAALAAGDLSGAIAATETLEGGAAEAAAYWLGRARLRARLNQRIEIIQQALAQEAGR